MLHKFRKAAGKLLVNVPGWKTDRKIIVFESDDWGAIRMSSKDSLKQSAQMGLDIEKCHYMQNDALASEEDLSSLFELLRTYKDSFGKHPAITANAIMANPDFSAIEASDYREYHYEPFTKTLAHYPKHKNCFSLWNDAISEGLFYPQYHGREHIQVLRWMNYLKDSKSDIRKAFNLGICGLSSHVSSEIKESYLAAYDWDDEKSRSFVMESISDGLKLFKKIFGFKSISTIAPNYTWHSDTEPIFKEEGVRFIQGSSVQKIPRKNHQQFKKKRHYTGQKNKLDQTYLVRNCRFEPSSNPNLVWVEKCLDDIRTAFYWKKPAIIEVHRVNFIGYINPVNRDQNLKIFEELLDRILENWPDVEFMTTDQLGNAIN